VQTFPEPCFTSDASFLGRRVLRLAARAVARLRLDLNVLTGAGVGYLRVTPLLCALASAVAVYAVARDTPLTARKDAVAQTLYLAKLAGLQGRARMAPTRLHARWQRRTSSPTSLGCAPSTSRSCAPSPLRPS